MEPSKHSLPLHSGEAREVELQNPLKRLKVTDSKENFSNNNEQKNTVKSKHVQELSTKNADLEDELAKIKFEKAQLEDKLLQSSCYFNKQLKDAYSQKNDYQVLCHKLKADKGEDESHDENDIDKEYQSVSNNDKFANGYMALKAKYFVLKKELEEIQKMTSMNADQLLKCSNLEKENETLTKRCQDLENDKRCLKTQLEEECQKVHQLQNKLSELSVDHFKCKSDLSQKCADLKTQMDKQSETIKSRDIKIDELIGELEDKDKKSDDFKKACQKGADSFVNNKNDKLMKGKIKELDDKVVKLKNDIKEKISECDQLKRENDNLDLIIGENDSEIENMKLKLKDVSCKEKALWDKLKICQQQMNDLQAEKSNFEEKHNKNSKELSKMDDDIEYYQNKIIKLKKDNSDLRDIANFTSNNIKALQAEVSSLKAENSRLGELTKKTEDSSQLEIIKLNELLNDKNNEVISTISDKLQVQKKLDDLTQFLNK